jgi:hypothetical protein
MKRKLSALLALVLAASLTSRTVFALGSCASLNGRGRAALQHPALRAAQRRPGKVRLHVAAYLDLQLRVEESRLGSGGSSGSAEPCTILDYAPPAP